MSRSNLPQPAVAFDSSSLVADIVSQVNSNTDSKTNAVASLVAIENDATQTTLANMSTGADLNANTANVNSHTSAKAVEINSHVDTKAAEIIAASGGDGDVFLPSNDYVGGSNVIEYYGAVNAALIPIGNTVLAVAYSRTGRGVITRLECVQAHTLEVWVDGKLFLNKSLTYPSSAVVNIVKDEQSATVKRIPYSQSIELRANYVSGHVNRNLTIQDLVTG